MSWFRSRRLLTKQEIKMLNGFWWASANATSEAICTHAMQLHENELLCIMIEEFAEAVEWLEKCTR